MTDQVAAGGAAKSDYKTKPTTTDVQSFLAGIPDERRRTDAQTLVELMSDATGQPPVMWGTAIVGFGSYHYQYKTGRQGDAAAVGFSPRKAASTLYLNLGFEDSDELLAKLGPHSVGKSCLYLKSLSTVDVEVLREMVVRSYQITSDPGFGQAG